MAEVSCCGEASEEDRAERREELSDRRIECVDKIYVSRF